DGEALAFRKRDVELGSFSRLRDGGGEDLLQAVAGDGELQAEALISIGHRPVAGENLVEAVESLLESALRIAGSHRIVEGLRFVVEGELPALKHLDPGGQRLELPEQVASSQPDRLFLPGEIQ